MSDFQIKYIEAVNSLMLAREENNNLQKQLKDYGQNSKQLNDNGQNSKTIELVAALDANVKLETKIAELKKSIASSKVCYMKEIQNLKSTIMKYESTLREIDELNMGLLAEGKCMLCSRSCFCHVPTSQSVPLKFKKSVPIVDMETLTPNSKTSTLNTTPTTPGNVSGNTLKTAKKITSNNETQKENVEKIRPRQDKLKSLDSPPISWRSLVKETRPKGTLTFLPKKTATLIEEGIINDFLVNRVEDELLQGCVAKEGTKMFLQFQNL